MQLGPDFLQNIRDSELLRQLLEVVVVLVLLFLLVQVTRRLVLRYIEEPERRYRASKIIGRTGGLLGLLFVVGIFFDRSDDLVTVLTVIGAGLAISMRETLLSLAGWFYISFRVPYRQGDRIEANGIKGDVIDIRLMHTTLMEIGGWVKNEQSTGRIVHFPNSYVFQYGVYNYTRGFNFIWNEISFTITFRSDWQAARELLLSLAEESASVIEQQAKREIRQMSREFLVHYSILTPFVYVQVSPSGVVLTLRYLCEVRKRRGTEHALTTTFLLKLAEHGGIELAYPMAGVTHFELPQFGPIPPPGDNGVSPQDTDRAAAAAARKPKNLG